MERGRWCFPCDSWIRNVSFEGPRDQFWQTHLTSNAHVQADSKYNGPLEGQWDGVTLTATIQDGRNLDYRTVARAMRSHGYTNKLYALENIYVVTYANRVDAEKALISENFINGACIKARPKFTRASKTPPVDIMKIKLDSQGSWEEQALELATSLKLVVGNVQDQETLDAQIQKLCTDVRKTFMGYFTDVECFVYGSRVTGLAGTDSDVDLFVKLDLSGTEFENKELTQEMHMDIIKKCDRLLRKSHHIFTNVLTIYQARIPVTRVLHLPTMIECDITCKNMLAVYNSRFLKFLTTLDKRIPYFFLVLKQWKKARGLSMSTYSLTMLGIFYLQTMPLPMLPPVQYLKDPVNKTVVENGWNCSFRDTHFEIINKMPLREMVTGFFKFLPTLDFAVEVICPLLGSTLEKWRFKDPENLDPLLQPAMNSELTFTLQFEKPVCIQDPFELNHNITKGMSHKHLMDLITMSSKVAELCDKNGRLTLLDLIKYDPPLKQQKQSGAAERIWFKDYFPSLDLLKENSIRELWFRDVVPLIYEIFTEVLTCNLAEQLGDSDAPPNKIQRLPSSSDGAVANWSFSTPYILINGRKKSQPTLKKGSRFIREVLATKILIQKFYNDTEKIDEKFHLKFQVEVTCHEKPTFVQLKIINNNTHKEVFKSVCRFVSQDLPNIVDHTLLSSYKSELETLKSLGSLEEQLEAFGCVLQQEKVAAPLAPEAASSDKVHTQCKASPQNSIPMSAGIKQEICTDDSGVQSGNINASLKIEDSNPFLKAIEKQCN